mmetsp:Transcript_42462/g.66481  ORF Transcript_42462/g.66481 Transcript_42462/m.66481 type:complete len:259 (-) Transcript_42462:483-1259(-)
MPISHSSFASDRLHSSTTKGWHVTPHPPIGSVSQSLAAIGRSEAFSMGSDSLASGTVPCRSKEIVRMRASQSASDLPLAGQGLVAPIVASFGNSLIPGDFGPRYRCNRIASASLLRMTSKTAVCCMAKVSNTCPYWDMCLQFWDTVGTMLVKTSTSWPSTSYAPLILAASWHSTLIATHTVFVKQTLASSKGQQTTPPSIQQGRLSGPPSGIKARSRNAIQANGFLASNRLSVVDHSCLFTPCEGSRRGCDSECKTDL